MQFWPGLLIDLLYLGICLSILQLKPWLSPNQSNVYGMGEKASDTSSITLKMLGEGPGKCPHGVKSEEDSGASPESPIYSLDNDPQGQNSAGKI